MALFKRFLTGIALLCAVSGCGYQIGALKISGENQTIAIPTFANKTGLPDIETRATNAIIEKMQIDGSYKVVRDPAQADLLLIGELISYSRDALSFSRTDVTNEYRGTLSAKLILKDVKTDKILWVAPRVEGQALFARAGDQGENERNSYPQLTADLAKYVVEKVVYGGW